ncbi:MAG: hypothetical protein IPK83_22250 [Planctomycetes bacterium]|nr:hypothetical protein [Planctomycetota bacterium]
MRDSASENRLPAISRNARASSRIEWCWGAQRALIFFGVAAIPILLSFACQGGRLTVFDPTSRSLSRHSAEQGTQAAARADDAGAERAFRHALVLNSKNADAHAGLARLAVRRGDEPAAADHYRRAIRCAPGNGTYAVEFADLLNRVAMTSLDRRQTGDAALRAYRYARSIIRYDGDLALRHGLCARDLGEMQEAITCLIDAAACHPSPPSFNWSWPKPMTWSAMHEWRAVPERRPAGWKMSCAARKSPRGTTTLRRHDAPPRRRCWRAGWRR